MDEIAKNDILSAFRQLGFTEMSQDERMGFSGAADGALIKDTGSFYIIADENGIEICPHAERETYSAIVFGPAESV